MENDSTFVAPEGVYSVTEEHKSLPLTATGPQPIYPTKLSTVIVRFPSSYKGGAPGLTQLLGGAGKDFWKDRAAAPPGPAKEDGLSVSSSETPEESNNSPDVSNVQDSSPVTPISPQDPPHHHHGLFHHQLAGKKKALTRPKHNMRTTSSTFITRLHSAEGLSRSLQAKQGEATYVFYNSAKNLYWVEVGAKTKVSSLFLGCSVWVYDIYSVSNALGPTSPNILLCFPHMSRYQPSNRKP